MLGVPAPSPHAAPKTEYRVGLVYKPSKRNCYPTHVHLQRYNVLARLVPLFDCTRQILRTRLHAFATYAVDGILGRSHDHLKSW